MIPSFVDPDDEQLVLGTAAAALISRLIAPVADDPCAALGLLRRHRVPAGAVTGLVAARHPEVVTSDAWAAAAAADRARGERHARAAALTEQALAPLANDVAMLPPTLGWMWASDVDVLIRAPAVVRAGDALRAAGFLHAASLLARLGRLTPGVERFVAVEGTEVLGAVELCRDLYDYGPSADEAIDRATRVQTAGVGRASNPDRLRRSAAKLAAARRVPLRAVLELMALVESLDGRVPGGIVGIALRRSIALERELGATPPTLPSRPRSWRPNVHWTLARIRGARREAKHRLRPRRLQVVFSGVDGAGKSTQVARLADHLDRVNVPAGVAWVRLGFSNSRALSAAARFGQRLLPADSHSAHQARATGASNPTPATRRGLLGWTWALAVTLGFVRQSRAAVRAMRGKVAIFDRGRLDARIALEFDYGGALALRLQHRLIERLVPPADHVFYLRLAGREAYERKEDMFAPGVLEDLVSRYDRELSESRAVVVLDARRPSEELAWQVLRAIVADPVAVRGPLTS